MIVELLFFLLIYSYIEVVITIYIYILCVGKEKKINDIITYLKTLK